MPQWLRPHAPQAPISAHPSHVSDGRQSREEGHGRRRRSRPSPSSHPPRGTRSCTWLGPSPG
eukprot:1371628-Pyramimonas_sp.AAC.1